MFGIKRLGSQESLTLRRVLWNRRFVKRELKNIIRRHAATPKGYTSAILQLNNLRLWDTRLNNIIFNVQLLDQMITQYRDATERDPFCNQLESKEIYASYLRLQREAKQVKKEGAQKAWATRRKHARNKKVRKLIRKRAKSKSRARKTRRKKS